MESAFSSLLTRLGPTGWFDAFRGGNGKTQSRRGSRLSSQAGIQVVNECQSEVAVFTDRCGPIVSVPPTTAILVVLPFPNNHKEVIIRHTSDMCIVLRTELPRAQKLGEVVVPKILDEIPSVRLIQAKFREWRNARRQRCTRMIQRWFRRHVFAYTGEVVRMQSFCRMVLARRHHICHGCNNVLPNSWMVQCCEHIHQHRFCRSCLETMIMVHEQDDTSSTPFLQCPGCSDVESLIAPRHVQKLVSRTRFNTYMDSCFAALDRLMIEHKVFQYPAKPVLMTTQEQEPSMLPPVPRVPDLFDPREATINSLETIAEWFRHLPNEKCLEMQVKLPTPVQEMLFKNSVGCNTSLRIENFTQEPVTFTNRSVPADRSAYFTINNAKWEPVVSLDGETLRYVKMHEMNSSIVSVLPVQFLCEKLRIEVRSRYAVKIQALARKFIYGRKIRCGMCLCDNIPRGLADISTKSCQHLSCINCTRAYLRYHIDDGKLRIRCFEAGCKEWITHDDVRRFIPDVEFSARLATAAARHKAHLDSLLASSSKADRQFLDWCKSNVRRCPQCNALIHRYAGCDHMQCSLCFTGFSWKDASASIQY